MPLVPAPVPPNVGDGSASSGDWEISSISPQAGYVDNANSVTLRGSFPASAYVWFGEQPGQVVHQTDDLITVRTPLRSLDGVVDVSLRTSGAGAVLTLPDAYAFVAWGSDQPRAGNPGGGGSNGGDGTTGGDSDNEGTDGGSNDGPSAGDSGSDGNGGDSNGGDTNGGGDEGTTRDRRSRMAVGSAVDLPSGLRGASISPNPAANVTPCSADPCTAARRS